MSEQAKRGRSLTGTVVSDKMDKTVVVEVVRQVKDKVYKKYLRKKNKFHAHDETNVCQMGDIVRIHESRPISKQKTWVLAEIIEKAK